MDKLRAIKFFCRTVEAKSFTSAAQTLEIPPSVLSKSISALEAHLQFTLFNRSTRRLSLTEAGARYYESCRQLMLDLEEAEAVARQGTIRPTGTLRVGFHPVFRFPLCQRLSEYLTANPAVDVDLVLTNSPATLLEEGLDVLLRVGTIEDSSFVARQLGWTVLITCASPAYLDARGRPCHPQDLRAHRAIIPGRRDEVQFTRWSFTKGEDHVIVTVRAGIVFRDGIGLLDAATWGGGVLHIYDIAARPLIEAGSLEPILTDWSCGGAPVYAVFPSRRNVPAKVRAFIEFARSLLSASSSDVV
jgi:LysR family transcriptional regulator, regulator for bpeEF and oprC